MDNIQLIEEFIKTLMLIVVSKMESGKILFVVSQDILT